MRHRFWSEYTARDFAQLDHENLIAVLPVGAVEQHGPHLPLSVDQTIVDAVVAASKSFEEVGRLTAGEQTEMVVYRRVPEPSGNMR